MGSLRGLNGAFVSALTAVMGPSDESYASRYETGSTEGIRRLLDTDSVLSAILNPMSHDARGMLAKAIVAFASKTCDLSHTHRNMELNRLLDRTGGAIKTCDAMNECVLQTESAVTNSLQECKTGITLSEGTSRGRLALKAVEARDDMTMWHDAIVEVVRKEGHIDNLILQLKDRDVDLAAANLDEFLDQDTKKVDDGLSRLEKRKKTLIDELVSKYGSNLLSDQDKDKDRGSVYSQVCPSHVDRQKGGQLGAMQVVYCKKNIRKTFAIYPTINHMVNGFNPATGVFPEPPCKENGYKGLNAEMIPRYVEQSKQLYDLYEAGGWPRDVLNAVLNPKPAGDKSDSKRLIGGVVGDGVMCLYAAISLYRPRSEKYKRSLKRAMCKAHLAFRAGDPRKHVADLEFNMTEILALGVRLPWDETGLEIIGTLGDRGTLLL